MALVLPIVHSKKQILAENETYEKSHGPAIQFWVWVLPRPAFLEESFDTEW